MKSNFLKNAVMGGMALMLSVGALAQSAQLKGNVIDETGQPLVGVSVSVEGTTTGTITDIDGNFVLNVPSTSENLLFQFIGMKDYVTSIGATRTFKVQMEPDVQLLNEAVAVGYGTMIRKDLSSSVSSVNSEGLNERASAINITQSLAGKMAGVQAMTSSGRPGGSMRIRVRGKGSINASSDPLYVLDGVVDVDPNMINSNDVESIDVLKDAAATAMYGAK